MPVILRVALPVPLPKLFDYLPPAHGTTMAGSRVLVPFGRGQRVGIVVATTDTSEVPPDQLKQITRALDPGPILDAELLSSLAWATDYWLGAPGEVLATALPTALRGTRALPRLDVEAWALTGSGREALIAGNRRGASLALLQLLADGLRSAEALNDLLPGWRTAARRLARADLIVRRSMAATRLPRAAVAGPTLNAEQHIAVEAIAAELGRYQPFLLDGVTGSGKTEVYLSLIAQVIAQGRQALMLVPEIGLAPQSVRRLRERLGVEVEVLHSNLAEGARARAWLRARNGEAKVILGTRSAIFTPLPKAGLIVVDEEHDASYKQHEGFRYHARDLAVVRARALGVPVLLGSATPSLETLANVETGRYRRLVLSARTGRHHAPTMRVLDMRAQRLAQGLSPVLLEALGECTARGEQALVFRNRRGYAPVLMCHACGWHAECPRCAKPMTLHAKRARLICHHCQRERRVPEVCPDCGQGGLRPQGHGTERLEETLSARFPDVPVLRIDRETMRRRDAFEQMLDGLDDGHAAILVGTQMLAKGHDLANLTLVAIAGVDEGLHSVDFRAQERLAQLVVQVAGRAGRALKPGRVLLQTHHPDNALLGALLQHGYAATAATLLEERRLLQLPPYASQALLRVDAAELERVDAFLAAAHAALPDDDAMRISGPMPAPMPLRAARHRGQLLLEADQRAALQRMLHPWQTRLAALPEARRVRWSIDVDPIDLY